MPLRSRRGSCSASSGQLSLVEERRRVPLTPIRLGAVAVHVFVHRSEFIVLLVLLSLSHILSTTTTNDANGTKKCARFSLAYLLLDLDLATIVFLSDWYKAYPPIAGRVTQVVRNRRPPCRRMSTKSCIEPNYDGKLSMMMVVPLDIFYEVIFSRPYHNSLKSTSLPVSQFFFVFVPPC